MPRFSVVIPTFNSEIYIGKTLETVLGQTYEDYEVIVSDDGSTDNTVEEVKSIFRRYPDKETALIANEHMGPGFARNKGVEAARGDWVAFLDADDLWMQEKLKNVADYIDSKKTLNLVCHSEIWQCGGTEKPLEHHIYYDMETPPFLSLYRQNSLSTSAVTVRKDLLVRAGLFDTDLPSSQDYELWLRLALLPCIEIGFIEKPLGFYVTREGNISANIEQRLCCMLTIGRRYQTRLKEFSRFPAIEKLRFEGGAYARAGLGLIRRGRCARGVLLLALGLIRWPRFDWIAKVVRNTVSV